MNHDKLNALQVATLLVAASYGIGFLFGSGEMAVTQGMAGAMYGIATAAGMLVLSLFARRLWQVGVPIWDLLGQRLGARAKATVALLSMVWMAGVLAAQIHGGVAVMQLMGVPSPWSMLGVLGFIYGVSRIDLALAARIFAGCLLASALVLAYALFATDGVSVYLEAMPRFIHDLSDIDPARTLSAALAIGVLVCLGADYQQFVFAARRPRSAALGCAIAAVCLMLVAFLPPAIVVAMQRDGALNGLADAKQVMPFLLSRVAATVGRGADTVMLGALGLAALGSGAAITRAMTTALGAVRSNASHEGSRVHTLIALAIGALLAARGQGIVDTMVSVNVIFIASVAVPFVAVVSRFSMPARAALAAMWAGFVVSAGIYFAGWAGVIAVRADMASLVFGLAASILGALVQVIVAGGRDPSIAVPRT